MDDSTLTRLLAVNLDGTFEHLLTLYGDRMYRFALRSVGSPEDAEEIAQDTFIRAYRALEGYPASQVEALLIRPWLYRIALNVVRNRVRRRMLDTAPLDGDGPASDGETPDSLIEAAERRRDMEELLARLPHPYRVAVVLRHVEGLGYGEMADVLSQPVGTVKSHVHRGIGMLRSMIENEVTV